MQRQTDIGKDALMKKEMRRLRQIFRDIPKDKKSICDGLIVQAARLRILLDSMWDDIIENGDTELFSQSEKTDPYERERPVARLFNTRDKNYQQIIRQLIDLLPEDDGAKERDALGAFLAGGSK